MMHNSPFTVAGMSSSTTSHHAPNLNSWGTSSTSGSLNSGFGDSLSQSRSHYQSGYLMSTSQSNNSPQGNQRVDEVPIVQTKAKMNQILSRGSTSDFGMESMFTSSRQRQPLADEDAPPMNSIRDIPNEINLDPSPARFQPRVIPIPSNLVPSSPLNEQTQKPTLETSQFSASRHGVQTPTTPTVLQPLYIIVFGYPADKYSVTAEFFKSLGESTKPDPNVEIINCFRIGYYDPGDALRAVRKNGELLGGSWLVGAKWEDPAQAEALLRYPVRNTFGASQIEATTSGNEMAVDEVAPPSNTPSLGTPIKLAPSTSAFKKNTGVTSKPATPQSAGWTAGILPASSGNFTASASQPLQTSPSKGVIGQVSDLIFGW